MRQSGGPRRRVGAKRPIENPGVRGGVVRQPDHDWTVKSSSSALRADELLLAAFDYGIKATLTILFVSFGIALPGLV